MATSSRKLSMVQVDVFTDRALTGNSLAVFLDGRGLGTEHMQALAREINLSETTFILPGDAAAEKDRGIRVRIFTVQEELPFAGHPTLGTAFVLRTQGASNARSEVRLELNVGTVPVHFTEEAAQPVFGEMTQRNPEFGAIHNVEAVARLTGLSVADFDNSVPIQTVSTGVPFTIVALRSLKTLQNLRLDFSRSAEYLASSAEILLLRLPRNGRSQSPPSRPHDFLWWRRSRHGLRRRMLLRLDGCAWSGRKRGAGFDRARPGSAPSQSHSCARQQAG